MFGHSLICVYMFEWWFGCPRMLRFEWKTLCTSYAIFRQKFHLFVSLVITLIKFTILQQYVFIWARLWWDKQQKSFAPVKPNQIADVYLFPMVMGTTHNSHAWCGMSLTLLKSWHPQFNTTYSFSFSDQVGIEVPFTDLAIVSGAHLM